MSTTDPNFDRWRGEISSKVDEYGRRLNDHDKDIRENRMIATSATVEIARLGTSVEGLRGDISRALADQAQARKDEFSELQNVVEANRMTNERHGLARLPNATNIILCGISMGALIVAVIHP